MIVTSGFWQGVELGLHRRQRRLDRGRKRAGCESMPVPFLEGIWVRGDCGGMESGRR
jgi:hypothetical protein